MLRLTTERRKRLADSFSDTAKFIMTAVVIGQFISKELNSLVLIIGISGYIIAMYLALLFEPSKEE